MLYVNIIIICSENCKNRGNTLCAFAKLYKTTISFVASFCPLVRPSLRIEQHDPQLDKFSWNLSSFRKFVRENSSFIQIWQEYRINLILMDPCIVDYLVEIPTRCSFVIEFIFPGFFKMLNMFRAAYKPEAANTV